MFGKPVSRAYPVNEVSVRTIERAIEEWCGQQNVPIYNAHHFIHHVEVRPAENLPETIMQIQIVLDAGACEKTVHVKVQ
jgi:hypothetical protein